MKNLFFALSAFVVIGLSSCGSVDCDDTTSIETKLESTLTAYAADQSSDNCKELKSALEESLDYSDCDGFTQEEIDNTNTLIDSLDC